MTAPQKEAHFEVKMQGACQGWQSMLERGRVSLCTSLHVCVCKGMMHARVTGGGLRGGEEEENLKWLN